MPYATAATSTRHLAGGLSSSIRKALKARFCGSSSGLHIPRLVQSEASGWPSRQPFGKAFLFCASFASLPASSSPCRNGVVCCGRYLPVRLPCSILTVEALTVTFNVLSLSCCMALHATSGTCFPACLSAASCRSTIGQREAAEAVTASPARGSNLCMCSSLISLLLVFDCFSKQQS